MQELDPNVRAMISCIEASTSANAKTIEKIDCLANNVNELNNTIAQHMIKMEHQEKINERNEKELAGLAERLTKKDESIEKKLSDFTEMATPILIKSRDTATFNMWVTRSLLVAAIISAASVLFDLKIGT